jgi:hypothetical protein
MLLSTRMVQLCIEVRRHPSYRLCYAIHRLEVNSFSKLVRAWLPRWKSWPCPSTLLILIIPAKLYEFVVEVVHKLSRIILSRFTPVWFSTFFHLDLISRRGHYKDPNIVLVHELLQFPPLVHWGYFCYRIIDLLVLLLQDFIKVRLLSCFVLDVLEMNTLFINLRLSWHPRAG